MKFNKEQREDGKSRQIVVKDKFFEFQADHEESQDSKKSPLTVELTLLTIIQDLDTRKITRKEAFKPLKTVYGGINGVRNYLKTLITESVYKWEDSGVQILNIYINTLYIKRQQQNVKTALKDIKMYNSQFSYIG